MAKELDLTYKIVRRLLRDDEVSFSRNKNFEAYEDERVKRAVRLYRHIESVEDILLQKDPSASVELDIVERDGETYIELIFARKGGRQMSYLEPGEWALLKEDSRVENIVEGLLENTDPDTRTAIQELTVEAPG